MKTCTPIILACVLIASYCSHAIELDTMYSDAMREYNLKHYSKSSIIFNQILKAKQMKNISNNALYDAACIYSLNFEKKKSLEILIFLAENRLYSNIDHISTDTDLNNLHDSKQWKSLISSIKDNKRTLPERKIKQIQSELKKAKKILHDDNGKLWNEGIWSENILVLDYNNTIYSLKKLPNSQTKDGIIHSKTIPKNTLGFSCSSQTYEGKEYAIVLTNYLDDESSTIIHELFHIMQRKHKLLNGDPIAYLDNYDARVWLRLEFQALKHALNAIDKGLKKPSIEKHITHAMLYRKLRQTKYQEYHSKEIEIETQEGLANYTGFILSTYPNKYNKAITEINDREQAQSYTRSFAYATGPAYGLIFDYLNINWRDGLDTTYDFLKIYETKYLKNHVVTSANAVLLANNHNNYDDIHQQETERKTKANKISNFYTDVFLNKPTLSVTIQDINYGRTFDMNGTMILKDKGIVYSSIEGVDKSGGKNFGDFSTIKEKEKLGSSGILYSFDGLTFTFPLPIRIEGNKIIGTSYTINLNNGWEVIKLNNKGDLIIKKTKL